MLSIAYNSACNTVTVDREGNRTVTIGQMVVFDRIPTSELAAALPQLITGCRCIIFSTEGKDTVEVANTILTNISLMGSV